MPKHSLDPVETSSTRNLKRLFLLRSLMLGGELLAVLGVHYLLPLELLLPPILAIIVVLALINVWTWNRVRRGDGVSDTAFFYQLCMDVFAIAGLLYFTGGATNPFAWLFLIPLIIAATVLSARFTWLIATLATLCYSLLMVYHIPLGGEHHLQHTESFSQHVFGMWFGFVMTAGLIAWFVVGMANTLRERDRLLAQAREETLRNEKLVALGTLATGTAHELGTPLATMAVLAGELDRGEASAAVKRKLRILKDQISRCKTALSTLSASAGEARAESGGPVPVDRYLNSLIDRWRSQRADNDLQLDITPGPEGACIIAEQTLDQALTNVLNNAVDASQQPVRMKARWDEHELHIDILDRGPGLQPHVSANVDQPKTSQKEFGMGLGLFLAHATIQRLKGDIGLADRPGGGTHTRIHIPLTHIK